MLSLRGSYHLAELHFRLYQNASVAVWFPVYSTETPKPNSIPCTHPISACSAKFRRTSSWVLYTVHVSMKYTVTVLIPMPFYNPV